MLREIPPQSLRDGHVDNREGLLSSTGGKGS
jgi:adhesin HecA-like repeat protein